MQIRDAYLLRPVDYVAVKGREKGTSIFEVLTSVKDARPMDHEVSRGCAQLQVSVSGLA